MELRHPWYLRYGSAPLHSPELQSGQLTAEQANAPAGQPCGTGINVPAMAGVADVMEMTSVNVNRPFVEPSLVASYAVGW